MDNNNNDNKQGCDVTKKFEIQIIWNFTKNTNILAIVTHLDSIETNHFKSLKTDLFGVREFKWKTKIVQKSPY